MSRIVKVCSVIVCVITFVVCIYCFLNCDRQAYSEIRSSICPKIDGHFEWVEETIPEGYSVPEEGMDGMKVVYVEWLFSNSVNDTLYPDQYWIEYYGIDGEQFYVLEKEDTENLIVSPNENEKILPPGQAAGVDNFVLVPEQVNEIVCILRGINDDTPVSERLNEIDGKSSFSIPGREVEDRFLIQL